MGYSLLSQDFGPSLAITSFVMQNFRLIRATRLWHLAGRFLFLFSCLYGFNPCVIPLWISLKRKTQWELLSIALRPSEIVNSSKPGSAHSELGPNVIRVLWLSFPLSPMQLWVELCVYWHNQLIGWGWLVMVSLWKLLQLSIRKAVTKLPDLSWLVLNGNLSVH